MKVFIYALICPINNMVRYIGYSKKPIQRLSNHLSEARKNTKTKKRAWLKYLLNNNLRPELLLLDEVELDEADFWERFYISLYKFWCFKLYNLTSVGEIKKEISEETKEKIRIARSKQIISEETKRKISQSNKGKKRTEETKRKISEKQKGKNNSMYNKDHSKQITMMKEINKGKKRTEETKRKISLGHKGRKYEERFTKEKSDKIKENLRIKNLGKKYSNEVNRKKGLSEKYIILQLTKENIIIREWLNMRQLVEETKFNGGKVRDVLKGRSKEYKNYYWKFKNR